jgi:hypothetical protein
MVLLMRRRRKSGRSARTCWEFAVVNVNVMFHYCHIPE